MRIETTNVEALHPELPAWLRDLHETGKGSDAIHARKFVGDLAKLPARWSHRIVARTIGDIFRAPTSAEEFRAWVQYEELLDRISRSPVRLDGEEDDIRRRAQYAARHCQKALDRYEWMIERNAFPLAVAQFMRGQGADLTALRRCKRTAAMAARAGCALWWRRQIRTAQTRAVETSARALGMVGKKADVYVSEESMRLRRSQLLANQRMLDASTAVNEWMQEYTLAELSDLGTASKDIRRNELVVRLRGFEEYANRHFHEAVFVTLTCPSRFHAYLHTGEQNPKCDPAADPRRAQEYLRAVWARIRAKLHRDDVKPYGIRIAEPHGDGTPHWHFVLFAPAKRDIDAIVAAFKHYGLADSPNEAGAAEHRVKTVNMDPAKGTATGYAIKYISKNIDGFRIGDWKIDGDLLGDPELNLAPRVEAWAATWGIRQFQQIGGPPVGLWREIRRVSRIEQDKVGRISEDFIAAFWSCNRWVDRRVVDENGEFPVKRQADWCGFMESLRPLSRRDKAISLRKDSAVRCSRFGDVRAPKVIGISDLLRRYRWAGTRGMNYDYYVAEQHKGLLPSVRHEWKIDRRSVPRRALS